jgi:hypothetical protein
MDIHCFFSYAARVAAGLVLLSTGFLSACRPGMQPSQTSSDTSWEARYNHPSPSRPILTKGDNLVFGGKDGTAADTIAWDVPPVASAVSFPGSRLGAVLVVRRGKGTEVRVYDPERTLLRSALLTNEERIGELSLNADGMVIAAMGQTMEEHLVAIYGNPAFQRHIPADKTTIFILPPQAPPKKIELPGESPDLLIFDGGKWFVTLAEKDKGMLYALQLDEILWSFPLPTSLRGTYEVHLTGNPKWPIGAFPSGQPGFILDLDGNQYHEDPADQHAHQ